MKTAIVKYNAGNIQSVAFALERLCREGVITDDPKQIENADKVIFPGVGEASSAMRFLEEKGLDRVIKNLRQPVLGICLGLQLMCEFSEENHTQCLNLFPAKVKRFDTNLKIPHVGWNQVYNLRSPLFEGVEEGSFVYFVHSYFAELNQYTIAGTEYGNRFSAAIQFNNFTATQFHPERSGKNGERILKNFLDL
ncbi:MAG: imidazole glycerol phosphate synthase subunit HisH [Bacteroidales bacterium]|nr:imidazole glycerol phosphate synthase subunit HisH [Bacteroidales bacterium]MCF8333657.1 imidazole glycerol phosphate synthase subunit HisH [Bacteroidales bacterium]